jgi:type IV secretory pathway VirB3-like protein
VPILFVGVPIVFVGAPILLIGAPIVFVGVPIVLVGVPILLVGVPMVLIFNKNTSFKLHLKPKKRFNFAVEPFLFEKNSNYFL